MLLAFYLTVYWVDLLTFLKESPDTAAIHQKFEHIDCWERFQSVKQQLIHQSCMGLTLTYPICLDQHQEQREDLFSQMLEKGIPMALWSRCSDSADHQEEIYALLTSETLSQLDQLLEQIKKNRERSDNEQNLGHHLAIWFDEPKRLIELKQFLKPGRLSA